MVKGTYQEKPALPFSPGMEVSGEVVAHGDGVSHPAIGTRVSVFGGHGGLAEFGVFPAELCVALPDAMDFRTAAAFQVAYSTSHVALDYRAQLKAGETLLVLGAAGGVGLTAVELGKLMGAKVIAAARGAEKLDVARQHGADHLIDTDTDDLREIVKGLGGADVVYDPVGGPLFTRGAYAHHWVCIRGCPADRSQPSAGQECECSGFLLGGLFGLQAFGSNRQPVSPF